jgi:hypothetical protein
MPVFELTAELRLHNNIGLALIAGTGEVRTTDSLNNSYSFKVYELGGQFVAYPISNFDDGLQLGAELLYVSVDTKDYPGTVKVSGSGEGLAMGPFVGYKVGLKGGFTFVVQGGFEYVTMRAKASDSSGTTASGSDNSVIPLLNLNLGWSF